MEKSEKFNVWWMSQQEGRSHCQWHTGEDSGREMVSVMILKEYLKDNFNKVRFVNFLTADERVSGGKNQNKGLHVYWATGTGLTQKVFVEAPPIIFRMAHLLP